VNCLIIIGREDFLEPAAKEEGIGQEFSDDSPLTLHLSLKHPLLNIPAFSSKSIWSGR
jgi:hypothetical protein